VEVGKREEKELAGSVNRSFVKPGVAEEDYRFRLSGIHSETSSEHQFIQQKVEVGKREEKELAGSVNRSFVNPCVAEEDYRFRLSGIHSETSSEHQFIQQKELMSVVFKRSVNFTVKTYGT
nr:hypothetical protein [Tanacetum cinerariifolium]